MNFEDIIWDIRHILGALKPESRVETGFLMNKVNNYRAVHIINKYGLTGNVDSSWMQNTGRLITTQVNSADDPAVSLTSINFSKCTIPGVVSLDDDAGLVRISGSSGQFRIYKTTPDNLYLKITGKSEDLKTYYYYYRVENAIYIYPNVEEISAILVQDNPMETSKFQTEYVPSGKLKSGETYVVAKGTISYGSLSYVEGAEFTATIVNGVEFGGAGKIKYKTQKVSKLLIHNYPISRDIAQACVLDILQREYQIEMNLIQDVVNDGQDQLKLVKSVQNEYR